MLSVCKKLTPGSRMKYKDEPYLQFFFSIWVFFHEHGIHRSAGEGRSYLFEMQDLPKTRDVYALKTTKDTF